MLRSMKYGLHGAVVAGLVAAPVVWNSVDRSVQLRVDGAVTTVNSTASTVGELLADRGLSAGRHDILAPARTTRITDGMAVVLRRGRLLSLDVDGSSERVWTTAPTVDVALTQLGYSRSDFVSVSRARRLPLSATSIAIRTPRLVTLVHDGERDLISTTEPTVGGLLTQVGVEPKGDDRLSVPPSTATASGQIVALQRVGTRVTTRKEIVRYGVTRRDDAQLGKGNSRVVTRGRNGRAEVTYRIVYVDGRPAERQRVKVVTLTAPRTQVIAVGTNVDVAPDFEFGAFDNPGVPKPAEAQAIARKLLAGYGWNDSYQYGCLLTMWNHESGWRTNAANSAGAYGIPQSLPGDKMSVAGPDWRTSARTQIKWGLSYIKNRYGTPCDAWDFWQAHIYY